MKWMIAPELLNRLYWMEAKSTSEIGKIYGVDGITVLNRMKEFDIPRRTVAESLRGREIKWADKISKANQGRVIDDACRAKISSTKRANPVPSWNKGLSKATHPGAITYGNRGESHWNWKGGISNERCRIRQSSEYKNWRKEVFCRDNWTCACGKRGGYLEADHIKGFAEYPELRFEVSNGRTLCKPCHIKITKERKQYGKQQSN